MPGVDGLSLLGSTGSEALRLRGLSAGVLLDAAGKVLLLCHKHMLPH